MIGPHSFFDAVATFEPYNRHFLQDIGAFQVGLGAVLLLAVVPRADALAAALVGVGAALHAVSHMVGHDLGGTPETDIPLFTALALLLLVAGGVRWRQADGRDRRHGARRCGAAGRWPPAVLVVGLRGWDRLRGPGDARGPRVRRADRRRRWPAGDAPAASHL